MKYMKIPEIKLNDEMTNQNSMSRIWISVTDEIYIPIDRSSQRNNPTPSEFFSAIEKAIKEAIKSGVHNITIFTTAERGYDCSTNVNLNGWRKETDAEYKRRLDHLHSKAKRDLDECIRQGNLIAFRTQELQKVSAAVAAYVPKGKRT